MLTSHNKAHAFVKTKQLGHKEALSRDIKCIQANDTAIYRLGFCPTAINFAILNPTPALHS